MSTIMKKLFNLNYIVLLAVLALFSACTEDNEYVPAGPCAETNAYRFAADQNVAPVLALTDSVYVVTLERDNTEEEVTVALNVKGDTDMLKAPSTVTFAAGEAQVSLNIEIAPSMEAFKNYYLEISIDESLVNPYLPDNNSVCIVSLMKEDYVPYAMANYVWGFIGGLEHKQVIEYSAILDTYRMKAPWADPVAADLYVNYVGYGAEDGEDVCFSINEETGEITVNPTAIKTGVVHPSYGSVTANFEAGLVQEGVLLFQYKWTVSAGSFGSKVDQVVIEEIYE